ncbi:MAG: hypothetical protein RLZZ416_460 [Candidatus Parcubacteria bacterium]|jgi:UPF0755 protein
MQSFEQFLQQVFDRGHALLDDLSEKWRPHSNRRSIAILILAGFFATFVYLYVVRPPDNFPVDSLVSVPTGESLGQVTRELADAGVVRSSFVLRVLVTMMGRERAVHAGDYIFKEPLDIFAVAHSLATGLYGLEPVRVRVPEGATTREMAKIYGTQLERFDGDRFLAKARGEEGYLFPDTYFFLPNATEDIVLETMRQNFDQHIATIQGDIASSSRPLSELIIMASILEREAFNTKDRRLISGVLWNRIDRKMPLQVDAVFAYTLGKGTFQLTMADLTSDSPYNTYRYKGLPPTPIGSPSLDSILAAADPIESDYLYFLADHSGVTHYCQNYACQLSNKRRYF